MQFTSNLAILPQRAQILERTLNSLFQRDCRHSARKHGKDFVAELRLPRRIAVHETNYTPRVSTGRELFQAHQVLPGSIRKEDRRQLPFGRQLCFTVDWNETVCLCQPAQNYRLSEWTEVIDI